MWENLTVENNACRYILDQMWWCDGTKTCQERATLFQSLEGTEQGFHGEKGWILDFDVVKEKFFHNWLATYEQKIQRFCVLSEGFITEFSKKMTKYRILSLSGCSFSGDY